MSDVIANKHEPPTQSPGLAALSATPVKPFLVIEPRSGWAALDLFEVWKYRDLLFTLALRDVKLRYKQTALGVLWVILQPLMAAGIFSVVFGKLLKAPMDGVPPFLFSFTGMLAYNAFSGTLTKASACVVGNAPLVSKVYFPRLILPLSTVMATLIDFGVAFILVLILMISAGFMPFWGILLVPVWLVLLIALAVGAGLYTSALMVRYRDLQYVIPVMVQMLLYATPIGYSAAGLPPKWRIVFTVNPLTGLIEAFRWSLLHRGHIGWIGIGYSLAFAAIALAGGAFVFKKMERQFADVI